MTQTLEFEHDRDQHRFVMHVGKHDAFVDYELRQGDYHLLYSEVPSALRGQGIGKRLVEKTFEAIDQEGRKSVAHCGFIKRVARDSDHWRGKVAH